MTAITAAEILTAHRAWMRDDFARMRSRPAGFPRGAWRDENPISPPAFPHRLRDTMRASRPVREVSFIDASNRLFVRTPTGTIIEIIDLAAPDADARLARYIAI